MRYFLLLFLGLALQSCFNVKNTNQFTYNKLTPEVFAEKLKNAENYYLIDVRTPAEYRRGHVKNAINYSFLEFNFGKHVDSLDRAKEVFVYCQTCHRSPFCGRILKRKGFVKVTDMKHGFVNWLKVDLPVDTNTMYTRKTN